MAQGFRPLKKWPSLFYFVGILFQTNYFTDSIEKFIGFWVHSY